MKPARFSAYCLIPLLLVGLSTSQVTPAKLRVSAGVAEGNVIKKVEPVYPQMARIARVQGKVVLQILISTEGKVESVRAISGHPILIQAAMDAVRQWEYKRYLLNGQPATVETTVEVPFSLLSKEDRERFDAAAKDFSDQQELCRELAVRREFADLEQACERLPSLAEKMDPERIVERIQAYRDLGTALFLLSKPQEALSAFLQEANIASTRLNDTDPDLGRAFDDVANFLQSTKDLEQAGSYYQKAVTVFEAAIRGSSEINAAGYAKELRPILRNYALLLREIGQEQKAEEIDRKIEALSLKTNIGKN